MAVPHEFHVLESFFNENEHEYNFVSKEDCGKFTEDFLIYLRNVTGNLQFKHLRKYGLATQYNKHAIDVLAYDNRGKGDGTPIMEIDILKDAETSKAKPSWQVRNTPYQAKDLMEPEEIEQDEPDEDTVPWASYWGDLSSDKITRTFMYDFHRANQVLNPGFGRWLNRALHSAFIGPVPPSQNGEPLGVEGALARHRPELCSVLTQVSGINIDPNVSVPDNFFPEWK